jgi:hypothetical protein
LKLTLYSRARALGTTNFFKWCIAATVVLSVTCVIWLPILHIVWHVPVDYTAVAEFLLVVIIAVEGGVALSSFAHDQRTAKGLANSAVFELYKTYLSVEYHENVRRPAWYAISRAKRDPEYRKKVLGGLAGELSGDEVRDAYECRRDGKSLDPHSAESFRFHDEYHRVQDILGFFTMLSALSNEADTTIVKTCDFFYDRWRVQLRTIVRELGKYDPGGDAGPHARKLKSNRWKKFNDTLTHLDKVFELEGLDWENDPLSVIEAGD